MKSFKKFKNIFKSSTQSCPSCKVELSRTAKICPECGHNFLEKKELKEKLGWKIWRFDANSCCFLIICILILGAWLFFKSSFVQHFVLFVVALIIIFLILVVLLITGLIFKIRNISNF